MSIPAGDPVAKSIREAFISPNVADSNMEPANMVDAIAMLANAVAKAGSEIKYGLYDVANSIRSK